jgi:hypothetical protein
LITHLACPASERSVSMCFASVISAFQSTQPRPRAQVASSGRSTARNASRLSPPKRVHAIARSHEGSPTPEVPKSMTALRRSPSTSRFPDATSPWNQTGGPCHVAASAASHAAVAGSVSILPCKAAIAWRVSAS